MLLKESCFRYHKGTDFQANHNMKMENHMVMTVVLDTTKVQIFKQITTIQYSICVECGLFQIPQRYRFSSKSQHPDAMKSVFGVVLDTTKVQIFKQITTVNNRYYWRKVLFQIPQRYRFSSKSQPHPCVTVGIHSCFRYHKGTDFQANHNKINYVMFIKRLFQIPQRYRFSSKSQRLTVVMLASFVVLDTTKVQIFKQITTNVKDCFLNFCCFRYHKGTDFQANHN